MAYGMRFIVSVFFLLPDGVILRLLQLARQLIAWRKPQSFALTVLRDLERIFAKPASSALARRMWREARPEQIVSILKGALRS